MNRQLLYLFTVAGRKVYAKPTFYPMASLLDRKQRYSTSESYSVMKRKKRLVKEVRESLQSAEVQEKPVELSLLARKLMSEQYDELPIPTHTNGDADVSASSYSTSQLKSRVKALATELDSAVTESAVGDHELSEYMEVSRLPDDFVESITFPEDINTSLKGKPSLLQGTEDRSIPPSDVPCVGCGALLQCQHKTFPGFMPSEYFRLLTVKEMKTSICQRCHYIQHCDAFVEVSTKPEEYAKMISKIRPTRSVVLMVVDVMDIQGSIIPHLTDYIGHKHPLVIVGNKADLLSPDSTGYLRNVTQQLKQACYDAGLHSIEKCTLISAKTGFGIERLISTLLTFYKKKVDVFIVGTANAGKSSLFNALLASDYCKHTARDLIQRATISVWPGTTLNLLKFPIMKPGVNTVASRQKRLKQEEALKREKQKIELTRRRQKEARHEAWELKEEVHTTDLRTDHQRKADEKGSAWGQEVIGYKAGRDGTLQPVEYRPERDPFEPENYDKSYWVYDTPGVINPNQIMNLLTPQEAPFLTPTNMIVPRCLLLKPGETLFVSGLARLDFVEGDNVVFLAVHCAPNLPLHVIPTEDSDSFYDEHVGTTTLGIPIGGMDRLRKLPSLIGKEFTVVQELTGDWEFDGSAATDIQLSSIGWISVAPKGVHEVRMRAYTPGRKGLYLRTPALMPQYRNFKGRHIRGTPFYNTQPAGWVMARKEIDDR